MALVFKPREYIGLWKGHELTLRSKHPTEDAERYRKECLELRMLLEKLQVLPEVKR